AIRAGDHCTQPLHDVLGTAASARASFYVYNTKAEIDKLVTAVDDARQLFA
ncbi:MAG: aminotransferase class V-fold PLP-dependent enzyme, partial [Natronomonas sp.]|uniref:aminotransferase class V-fold PLP-dependent enzyme n=1 Tax=Natronomonas sp. TaxID=2184060 RepID=UPI00286FBCEA